MSPSPLSTRPLNGIDAEGIGMRRSSSGPIGPTNIGSTSSNLKTSSLGSSNMESRTANTSPTTSNVQSPLSSPPIIVESAFNIPNSISNGHGSIGKIKRPSSVNTHLAPLQTAAVNTPAVPQLQFSPVGSNTGAGSLWVLSFVNSSGSASATPMDVNPQAVVPPKASNCTLPPVLTSVNSGLGQSLPSLITSSSPLDPEEFAYGATSSFLSNMIVDDLEDHAVINEAFDHALNMSLDDRDFPIASRSLVPNEIDAGETYSALTTQPMTPIEAMYQQMLTSQNPMAMYNSMNTPRFPTPLCRHFIAGRCWAGTHCRFTHLMGPPPSAAHQSTRPICKHFIVGRCWAGSLCRFAHFPVTSQAQQDMPIVPMSPLHHSATNRTDL
jgi:hypothetical protein